MPWKVTGFDGLHTVLGFDSYLRRNSVTNTRGKLTTTAFVNGTMQPSTVTDPSSAQTAFSYDTSGRLSWQRDRRNYYTRYSYNTRNQVTRQWGDGAMPVEYGYDGTYGDRITMKTYREGTGWDGSNWPSSPGTADTTTWAYDVYTGLLSSKMDAADESVGYTYNSAGRLATFTWARGTSITYSYNSATGELTSTNYSDATPDLTFTYTRLGQMASVTDATGTRDMVYDSSKPWRLSAEAMDSFYADKYLSRRYETSGMLGRYDGFKVGSSAGSNSDLEQDYGYTTSGRFETLMSGRSSNASTRTFSYAYKSDAALVESLSITGGHAFTVTRTYDTDRDLVTAIESKWSTTSRVKYAYAHDERGFRTSVVQSGDVFSDYGDSTHRIFSYNGRGELTADIGYKNATPTSQIDPLPGRRHEFSYDNAGNRQWSDRNGISAMRDDYATNNLNQYVSRENNTIPVSGTANTDSNVSLKGKATAAGRKGRYWGDEVVVNNLNNPWYGTLTLFTAKPGGGGGGSDLYRTETRNAQIAKVLQNFTYDDDGNLTSDGVWDYTWDAENRLTKMQTTTLAASCGYPNRELDFKYDYLNRRVEKRVINLTTSTDISYRRFLYDGWNLVAEYDFASSTLTLKRSYTWGLDVMQSITASGGVGGLLQIADHASGNTYLPAYDGNGNIAALLNASSGNAAAIYEYSSFGEPLRAQVNDSIVADQPFRFSTKFTDVETGLVYYGHRYYEAKNGRFINRDPIEESGGLNLYGFVRNNPVNRADYLGCNELDDLLVKIMARRAARDSGNVATPQTTLATHVNGGAVLSLPGPELSGPFATVTAAPQTSQEPAIETEPEVAAVLLPASVTKTPLETWEDEVASWSPEELAARQAQAVADAIARTEAIRLADYESGRDLEIFNQGTSSNGEEGTVMDMIDAQFDSVGMTSYSGPGLISYDAGGAPTLSGTGSSLSGNAERDIAYAYVWASRFYPSVMKGIELGDISNASRPPGYSGFWNPLTGNIQLDYSKMPDMGFLVGALVHEAAHAAGGILTGLPSNHQKLYGVQLEAQTQYYKWIADPKPPGGG